MPIEKFIPRLLNACHKASHFFAPIKRHPQKASISEIDFLIKNEFLPAVLKTTQAISHITHKATANDKESHKKKPKQSAIPFICITLN